MPDPSYLIWYAVNGASLMSELYYTYPAVYVLLYLAIDFLFLRTDCMPVLFHFNHL